jgi:hypothetical protein
MLLDDAGGLDASAQADAQADAQSTSPDAAPSPDAGSEDDASTGPAPCIDYDRLRARLHKAIADGECGSTTCPMIDVVAQGAEAQAASLGKRILLIDEGVVVSAATRYRRRTLAYVAMNAQGTFEEVHPTFPFSRDAAAVLRALADEAPTAKAAELELDDAFFAKFAAAGLPETLWGHGTDFLPFLAEYVPDSQFVVSDTPMRPPVDCGLLLPDVAGEPAWDELSSFVDNLRLSLGAIITRHDVHALHLSWGLSHQTLAQGFEVHCGATASRTVTTRIMRLYAELFRSLTALETSGADGRRRKVVIFQAGEWAENNLAADDTLDCADIPGRVRSFYVAYDGDAVPPEGSYDQGLLPSRPGHNLSCNDVFMVMGYVDTTRTPRANGNFAHRPLGPGTHTQPWPPASSFSTPIALAHYFLGQAHMPDAGPEEWIAWLTRGASKPILDPLLHHAFAPGGLQACRDEPAM